MDEENFDRILAKAGLYRLIMASSIFGASEDPLALEIEAEINQFARSQMGNLLGGVSAPAGNFTNEEIVALKHVAAKILGEDGDIPAEVGQSTPTPKKRGRPRKVSPDTFYNRDVSPVVAKISVPETLKTSEPIRAVTPSTNQDKTYNVKDVKIREPKKNQRLEDFAKRVGGVVKGNKVVKQRQDESGELLWEQLNNGELIPFWQEVHMPPPRPGKGDEQPAPLMVQEVPGGSSEAAAFAGLQANNMTKSYNEQIGRGGALRVNAEVVKGSTQQGKSAEDVIAAMTGSYGLRDE